MKVLVTGASGVIGQNLMARFKKLEIEAVLFDIKQEMFYDINSSESVNDIFEKTQPDVCIHMAAQVGRFNGENYPHLSIESNMTGTLNIVKACLNHNTKLVNFSTSEIYGHNSVFGQPDILEQNGMYGITKLAAEGIVKHYVDTYRLKAVSIRPFMVYGPHETPNGVFRSALSNFINAAMNEHEISAHEGCVRAWCYMDDFIDGLLLVLDLPMDKYEAFSIGTDEYRTMEDAAKIVVETVGKGSYKVTPVPEHFVSAVKKADFTKMRSLGHFPKITLEEGVKRTYEWMKSNL